MSDASPMPAGDRRVSVIVRALNEVAHLPALFDGLEHQTLQPAEVILVDSGSTDGTVSLSRERGARIVEIDPASFSFGRALNVGCEAATGDVFVFASAHVYPIDEHWLANLVEPFCDDDDVALVYGRQTGDHRNKFSEIQLMRQWFPEESDPDQRTPFCNNANCAVSAKWWELLPYDETLTGLEDIDWARRALDKGGRLVYRADAGIVHVHTETFGYTLRRYQREAIAYHSMFSDQRFTATEAIGLFTANVARDYLAAVPRKKLVRNLVSIPAFRAAQYLGTWRGFRDGDASAELRRRLYYPKGFTPRRSNEARGAHR